MSVCMNHGAFCLVSIEHVHVHRRGSTLGSCYITHQLSINEWRISLQDLISFHCVRDVCLTEPNKKQDGLIIILIFSQKDNNSTHL